MKIKQIVARVRGPFLLASIVTSILYWLLEAEIHAYIFPGHSIIMHLFTPTYHEIVIRVIIIGLILVWGASAQYLVNRLKQEKDAIKFAQAELDQIFNTAVDGMCLIDTNFNVLNINATLSTMSGKEREETIGKKCYETFYNSLCHTLDCPLHKILQGERYIECDVAREGHDGMKIHCIVTATEFRSHTGELVGIVEDIRDITERKKIEEELMEHRDHLERMVHDRTIELKKRNDQLQKEMTERRQIEKDAEEKKEQLIQADKLASLGTLVTGVAHEINNPNQFIMSNTPFLKGIVEEALPILNKYYEEHGDFIIGGLQYSIIRGDLLNCFKDIIDGAVRIDTIVKELKNFAKKEPHKKHTCFNINQIIDSAISLMSSMLKKSTTNFNFQPDNDMPMIEGNSQRLEQVIINLIQNACHALTDTSQGIFITTSYQKEKGTVTVNIKDEGIGIPLEYLKRIKDPFFTTKRESGGTGLGLSISQTIIDEHNGLLALSSEEGQGTTAKIILSARNNYHE
ncbi:MAG: ATP-binding protein [bacterium]